MSDIQFLTAVFDGSFDGFLTIIFKHYYEGFRPNRLVWEGAAGCQLTLETDYIHVETDLEKAKRVYGGIIKKISVESAEHVYRAFLADGDETRFTAMYIYTILGFQLGKGVETYYQNEQVAKILKLSRQVMGEAHLFLGFTRFAETKKGLYYAAIDPKHNVLPLVAAHFANRLGVLQWILHDTTRGLAAVYDGERFEIREADIKARVEYSLSEEVYQELWIAFFNTITIEGRKNKKLQQANLPKRYRHNVVEWKIKQ